MYKNITFLVILAILCSCGSSLSPKECQSLDWYQKGLADGSSGKDFRLIDRYKITCGKVSIMPDEKQYYAGYHKGLLTFCSYDNGFEAGRRGSQAIGCPDDTEYLAGWKKGIKVHVEERERREIEKLTRPGNTEIASPGGSGAAAGPK